LPAEVPLMVPISAEENTATLAGPPRAPPAPAKAKLTKYSPTRLACRKAAKVMNRMM